MPTTVLFISTNRPYLDRPPYFTHSSLHTSRIMVKRASSESSETDFSPAPSQLKSSDDEMSDNKPSPRAKKPRKSPKKEDAAGSKQGKRVSLVPSHLPFHS